MIPALIDEFLQEEPEKNSPSYTDRADAETKRIYGHIDGIEALKQAIYMRLSTQRGAYPVYSAGYGVDWRDLFGMSYDWVCAVLPDRIQEALMPDDRILEVHDFVFSAPSKHVVKMTFGVRSVFGDFSVEDMEVRLSV